LLRFARHKSGPFGPVYILYAFPAVTSRQICQIHYPHHPESALDATQLKSRQPPHSL